MVKELEKREEHLEQIQQDQQRILDLLSARSIEQEAKLRQIK